MGHAHNFKDLTGQKLGRFTAIKECGRNEKRRQVLWLCMCDCGKEKILRSDEIRFGNTKSCGCQKIDSLAYRNKYNNPMLSEESRKKSSKSQKGKRTGADNHNYNPNLTEADRIFGRKIPVYTEWRKAVYERDNFTCQCCGDDRGGNLVAHHKESYNNNPDLRTEVENGITLCEECHNDFHHLFGFGYNTKKQIYYFMLEMGGI